MKQVLCLIALSLFVAVPAAMAAPGGYVKIEGIEGEAREKDHKGWIEIASVEGLPQDSARATGSGLSTGKRQHKPISVTKPIDKSTPLLAKAAGGAKTVVAEAAKSTGRSPGKASPALAEVSTRAEPAKSSRTAAGRAVEAASPALEGGVMALSYGGKTYLLRGARLLSSSVAGEMETLVIDYDSIEEVDSPAAAVEAQDYNSSRSNKARG